jgi:hypothetical protein
MEAGAHACLAGQPSIAHNSWRSVAFFQLYARRPQNRLHVASRTDPTQEMNVKHLSASLIEVAIGTVFHDASALTPLQWREYAG